MSRASVARGTTSKRSTSSTHGRSSGEYDKLCAGTHEEGKDAKCANIPVEIIPKALCVPSTAPRNATANNISASVHYIRSILPASEDSSKNSRLDHRSDSFQIQNVVSSAEFCVRAKSAVETICKFLKNDRAKDPEGS
jgi:hypothetical protein